MDETRLDAKQILARLVGRYGQAHGRYLFGEVCLLQTLGYDAFQKRHTPHQLLALAEQLRPLALWPHPDPAAPVDDAPAPGHEGRAAEAGQPPEDPLLAVARTLSNGVLMLALGIDLFGDYCRTVGDHGDAMFERMRAALVETLGFVPPRLVVTLGEDLAPHVYRLYLGGEAIEEGDAYLGQDLVLGPEHDTPPALPYAWRPDPAGAGWVAWMPVGPEADVPELPRLHWLTAVSRHLSASLPRHADKMLTVPRVYELVREAEPAGYDRELERYVSLPELKLVFQTLLAQGLPLRPIAPMLESMVTAILAELVKRPLTPPDMEKLNRQLPAFSTGFLVAAVRRGLGLPETAAPRFTMPPPPLPLPLEPAISPEAKDVWRSLADASLAQRPCARYWMAVLRAGTSLDDHRSGLLASLLMAVPATPRPGEDPDQPSIREVLKALMAYVEVARPLARVKAWLDGAGTLDAEARELLESGDFATTRHKLNAPGRLLPPEAMAKRLARYVERAGERV